MTTYHEWEPAKQMHEDYMLELLNANCINFNITTFSAMKE